MNSTKTVHLQTRHRTGTLTVTEHDDRIETTLVFSRYGPLGDERDLCAQLLPHFLPFNADPRPVVSRNPHSGEVAIITDIGALILPPSPSRN
jgi:hypothetical protein